MNRSLYTLPLSDITFEDIKHFCDQRLSENPRLEYKAELNDNVIRTIAAMANTDGGMILVGVPEEKEEKQKEGQDSQRNYPGAPEGIDIARKSLEQWVVNSCYGHLQPSWAPEVKEIRIEDKPDRAILLIRVDRESVPSLPVFYRQKGILVRLGEGNHLADLERIRFLFQESQERASKSATDFGNFIYGKYPGMEGFCWCYVGVVLPMSQSARKASLNSSQIKQLRQAIENHKIGRMRIWTQKWYPLPCKTSNPIERWKLKSANFQGLGSPAQIQILSNRGEKSVHLYPDPIHPNNGPLYLKAPDAEYGEWSNFWFDVRGYLLASVGFPWDSDGVKETDIYAAIYAMLDLFNQEQVKNCYPDCLWEYGKFKVFAGVSQFPGKVKATWEDAEPPLDFASRGSAWSGPHEMSSIDVLEPESIAKGFVDRFLAWAGYMHYEDSLATFDIKSYVEKL